MASIFICIFFVDYVYFKLTMIDAYLTIKRSENFKTCRMEERNMHQINYSARALM